MDLGTMLRVMIKRWYVSVPALVLALTLPVVAWFAVPAKYQSTSTISLLNSAAASSGQNRTGNPFTAFDNSLTGMADYLARTLNSDQAMAELAGQGVTDLASAQLAPNASGPFITLTIAGKDPQQILAEMKTFDDYAIAQLAAIQNKTSQALKDPLPANTLLRAIVMVPPQKPVTSMKSKLQDVAAAAVGGTVLLFVGTFGAEAWAVRRGKPAAVPPRNGEAPRNGEPRGGEPRGGEARGATQARRRPAASGGSRREISESAMSELADVVDSPQTVPAARPASEGTGLAKRRPSAAAPTTLETTIALPRYREPEHEADDEADAEPWIDIEPLPLIEDFAVGDREPGTR